MLLLNKFEIISVNISSNICLSFSAFLLTFSNISKLEDLFILCYRLLRLCFFGLIFSLSLSLFPFSLWSLGSIIALYFIELLFCID